MSMMQSSYLRSKSLPCRPIKSSSKHVPKAVPASAKLSPSFTLDEAKHQELVYAAKSLAEAAESGGEQFQTALNKLESLSEAAGTNAVFPSMNDGNFKSYALTGRTKERTSSVITLGLLGFNAYQPARLKIKMTSSEDSIGIIKGPRDGVDTAYVIASPFEVVEVTESKENTVKGTGIRGRSLAIGEYSMTEGNSQRLGIKFTKMQLEPFADNEQELHQWLDTFTPHNPNMDPKTGVLVIRLPENSPQGFMDYLLMIPEFQLVQGNAGSKTLLQRVS